MAKTNEHDKANEKPDLKPEEKKPAAEFSVTATAERVAPTPAAESSEKDKAKAQSEIGTLQKKYDELAEQTRLAAGDPAKQGPLKAQKGEVTRQIDALKRKHGIE